jgi:UDP-N-acetylglucosamine 4,6-dehydratase
MCPSDDSHLTLEFKHHYVIRPTIQFNMEDLDYTRDVTGDTGKPVEQGFAYNSGTNPHFLGIDEIRAFNRVALESAD